MQFCDVTAEAAAAVAAGLQPETELTPGALAERYQPEPGIEEYYSELGKECADAAIGVDLLLLYGGDDDDDGGNGVVPDFCIAAGLPDRSCLICRLLPRQETPSTLLQKKGSKKSN